MHVGPVDGGGELRVLVDPALPRAPVVAVAPMCNQPLDEREGDAIPLVAAARLRCPPGPVQPVAQVGQLAVRDGDAERLKLLALNSHLRLPVRHSRALAAATLRAAATVRLGLLRPLPGTPQRTADRDGRPRSGRPGNRPSPPRRNLPLFGRADQGQPSRTSAPWLLICPGPKRLRSPRWKCSMLGHGSKSVARVTCSQAASSARVVFRLAAIASAASLPSGRRRGVVSALSAVMMAAAALAGSPGCLPSKAACWARMGPMTSV